MSLVEAGLLISKPVMTQMMQNGLRFCKLYQNKDGNRKGYILQRLYRLSLTNEENNLSANKSYKTAEGKVTK